MGHAASTDDERAASRHGLAPEEDRELRQLTWFARAGSMSERSIGRLAELISRDRRREVRDARPNPSTPASDEVSTLPPLWREGSAPVKCPNCGSVFSSEAGAAAARQDGPFWQGGSPM